MTAARPARPSRPFLTPDSIPEGLCALKQWVSWRYEWRDDRWTKVPYDANAGRRASSTDPSTWSTFERALAHREKAGMDGVGFVVTADDPYVAIDLDDCITDAGELIAEAQSIVDQLDTYTEISPSGLGIRIIARGSLPARGRKTAPPSKAFKAIEAYMDVRFVTITGQHLEDTPTTIACRELALLGLYTRYWPQLVQPAPAARAAATEALSDNDVVAECRAADPFRFGKLYDDGVKDWGEDQTDSSADIALCNRLAYHSGDVDQVARLWGTSALGKREKFQRADYVERTITDAFLRGREFYDPSRWITLAATSSDDAAPAASPAAPADQACPSCCTCCQANAELKAYTRRLEAELLEARAHHRETMAVLRAPNLKPNEKLALVMAAFRWMEASSHIDDRAIDPETGEILKTDPQAERRVSINSMAESMGLSRTRASAHLKRWEAAGVLKLRLDRKPTTDVDPETGETIWRTETYLSLPYGSPIATLRAARTTTFDRETPWGGAREKVVDIPTCAAHADVDHCVDFEIRCPADDHVTGWGSVPVSCLGATAVEALMSHVETSGTLAPWQASPPPVERSYASQLGTSVSG